MEQQKLTEILRGNFENLIEEKSKTVKIFLSSTFADTHAERDYLIAHIYPKLRDYCKKTYGLEFQVYDMRWGISHEVTSTHQATTVCLNEIKNCQKYSAGPNFIGFLSHRYGSRCLPTRIKSNEFKILSNELLSCNSYEKSFNHIDSELLINVSIQNLLEFCYELDDNETPARYRLKYIPKIIPSYNESNPAYSKIWSKIELKLGDLLRNIADNCLKKKLLTETEHSRYFVSVTEKEMFNGILMAKNVASNVLFFEREIENLEENIEANVSLARRFTELDNKNKIDESVKVLLDDLKNKKIPSKLPELNIFKFKVKWDSRNGITLKTHEEYIRNFGETFYEQVKRLIDRNQEEKNKKNDLTGDEYELFQEVIDHAIFCNETVSKFHGRADVLERVQSYILDSSNNIPFIVYGESGCGKTAILAKVTSQILKIVPDPHNYSVLLRFLGTTPISTDIIKTINSLIEQLNRIYNLSKRQRKIQSELDAQMMLYETFELIRSKYHSIKIVIVLDSIDQLNPIYYRLNWLITVLPPNVKMIYSTLPNHNSILTILEDKLNAKSNDTNFLKISTLDPSLAEVIILDWLKKIQRYITNIQLEALRELFKRATLYPLYIKLIFDIISTWTSFYEPDSEFNNCLNIDKSIVYIFKSLEKVHGNMLFSRAIVYMSVFKNGISENEIEDILSIDDDVLYDIFEFHAPPIRKLPIALWARIKNSLKEYMVEKEIDDTRVIYWYHRRFIEVANSYYISKLNSDNRTVIFSNVVDFYNETWKNKPKPYKYNEYLAKKFQVKNGEAEASRDTGIQPTVFTEPSGKIRFNKRKINELPSFIAQLTANLAIPLACDNLYFDYYFLIGSFFCLTIDEIFDNLQNVSQYSSYNLNEESKKALNQLKVFQLSVLQCGQLMKDNPDSCLIYFFCRNINFYKEFSYFTKLVNEYDRECAKYNPLILAHQYLDPPTAELIFQLEKHSHPITHAVIGGDNDRFIISLSNKINIFDLQSVREVGEVKIPKFKHQIINFSTYFETFNLSDKPYLNELKGGFVLNTLKEIKLINFDSNLITDILTEENISNSYIISKEFLLVCFENEAYIKFYNLSTNEMVNKLNFNFKIKDHSTTFKNQIIIDLEDLECIYTAFRLETNEIVIYKIHDSDSKLNIDKIMTLPSPGINIKSLNFTSNFLKFGSNKSTPSPLIITFENSSFCQIDIDFNTIKYFYVKLLIMKNLNFTLIDYNNEACLFLASNNSLFIFDFRFKNYYELLGNFKNGCLMSNYKVIGIENEQLVFFEFSMKEASKNQRITKLGTIDAHFEEITFLFPKDEMILTTSKDYTLKIFGSTNIEGKSLAKIKFHKAADEIKKLININEDYLLSLLVNSNHLHLWEKSTGNIFYNLVLESDEKISDVYFDNQKLVILSYYDDKNSRLRFYSIKKEQSSFSINEIFRRDFHETKRSQLLTNYSDHTKYFLISNDLNGIKISILNEQNIIHNFTLDLPQIEDSIILKACSTSLNSVIVIFTSDNLYFINSKNCKFLNSKDLTKQDTDIEYFLSPTNIPINNFYTLTSIENTDNLLMLDNIGNIHYIEYLFKFNEIKNFKSSHFKFNSFKVNKNLLLAHELNESKLVCFDLNQVLCERSFKSIYFTIDLNKDEYLSHFDLSLENTYAYTIENKKIFKFYQFEKIDQKLLKVEKTAELMLYAEVTSVLGARDFLSFGMKDRKVVSFLIGDKNNLESTYERIKSLPSRGEPSEELKRINKLISNDLINALDESSDEDDVDLILDEKNSQFENVREKIKNSTKYTEIKEFSQENISTNLETLEKNWLINFIKTNIDASFDVDVKNKNPLMEDLESNYLNETKRQIFDEELYEILSNSSKKSFNTKNTGHSVLVSNNYSSQSCSLQ